MTAKGRCLLATTAVLFAVSAMAQMLLYVHTGRHPLNLLAAACMTAAAAAFALGAVFARRRP